MLDRETQRQKAKTNLHVLETERIRKQGWRSNERNRLSIFF